MQKGILVKDIVDRQPVRGVFTLVDTRLGQGRNGQPYWSLRLKDATGSLDGKIWAPLSGRITEIPDGSFAFVSAHTALYRDQIQAVIDDLRLLDKTEIDALDMNDFNKSSARPADEMLADLMDRCRKEFIYEPWAKLVFSVLEDENIGSLFRSMPAAKSVHHAHQNGLLEHTLNVFDLCQKFADKYPLLDRQTLLAGALFHDLGKIRELSGIYATEYTDEGRLEGHIILGLEILAPFLASSGLDAHLAGHLRHLILSHHGELEFGAARLPQTMEAFALHYADNLDAKMEQCRAALENAAPGDWSPWQSMLNRNLHLAQGTPACAASPKSGETGEAAEKEASLYDAEGVPFPGDDDIPVEDYETFVDEDLWDQARETRQPDMGDKKAHRAKGHGTQCSLLLKE